MLININGRTQTVLDNPYNRLKYEMFDGNRIFYKFADNIILQETFDNGIFNCTIDKDTMQLRCANQIAEAIKAHKESGSYARFKKIFSFAYTAKYQEKIIDEFLEYYIQTRRIEKVDIVTTTNRKVVKGYQIDNRFAVDEHNQAYFWDEVNTEKDQQYKFKHGWNQLCIVTKG
ncbi:hypothetical protein IH799_01130 [candidate division KSB1 bacterium]|nr:hypothetical protein [candidate division KSB1 bacterium]